MLTPVLPAASGADLTEVAPTIAQASGKSRRDIAFVPLLVIGAGALGLLVATALRGDGSGAGGRTVTLGLAATALLLCLAWVPAYRLIRGAGSRAIFRAYTAAATTLLIGLVVIAVADAGLSSVAVGATVLVAANVGLAFPTRWSRNTIVAIAASLAGVHAVHPVASTLEAVTVLCLVLAAWVIGLILRRGHRGASCDALLLSRGDQVTGALNRRGFIENVAYELEQSARRREPLLLVIVGLRDGLGAALGGAPSDGDALLAEVADTIAGELPQGAALGRVGAAKLGVVVPGGRSVDADWFAGVIREALDHRATVFVGAASSPDGSAPLAELFDVAEACLLESRRRSPEGAQLSEVRGDGGPGTERRSSVRRPPVSYARLRSAGGPPAAVEPWGLDGQWLFGGMCTVAFGGTLFLVASAFAEHDGLAAAAVRYGGLPWVLTALAVGLAYRHHPRSAGHPPLLPVLTATALVTIGTTVAALSTGDGALSPIIAALYLKVFFDGSTFGRGLARPLAVATVVAWLAVLGLGPADALWVAPFQAVLLAGAFALGTLGHNAYGAATTERLDLARTDPFTGLVDRGGFYERGEALLGLGAPAGRGMFGVVLIDVEPLSPRIAKAAPASGPRRTTAGIVAQHLGDASVVARFGSGDFRAIVRVDSRGELDRLVDRLRDELSAASSVCRIGSALHGPDGITLDALLAIASHRAEQDVRFADAA